MGLTALLNRGLAVVVVLGASVAVAGDLAPAHAASDSVLRATIDYAVDGDTLHIREPSGDFAYVRLVGIDTPEDVKPHFPTECGARAAAASMDRLAPEGASVVLRYDTGAGHVDRYGRILAHAYIGGRQLEIAQLRRGWAYVYRYHHQRFNGLARFEAAARSARRHRRGVWGRCGGDFHSAEPGVQH